MEVNEDMLATSLDGLSSMTVITGASVEFDAVDWLSSEAIIL